MVCTKLLLCYGLHRCVGTARCTGLQVPQQELLLATGCKYSYESFTRVFTRYGLQAVLLELLLLQILPQEFLLSWVAGTTTRVATLADTTTGVSTRYGLQVLLRELLLLQILPQELSLIHI